MLYLTCTMISSVDLAHYRVSHAKDWVLVLKIGYLWIVVKAILRHSISHGMSLVLTEKDLIKTKC